MQHTVYIGIHPAQFNRWGTIEFYGDQDHYKELRNARLQDCSLDQLLLLSSSQMERTKDAFNLRTPYWDGRIFSTADNLPILDHYSFEDFALFLEKTFPATSYVLWGAELHLNELGERVGGCVKYVYDELPFKSVVIELESCFIIQYK